MGDRLAKKNVVVLAFCQALFTSSTAILITLGGLVGHQLADHKSLATLPVSAVVVGTALATIPASLLMRRIGRRLGFQVGIAIGMGGALAACAGIWYGQFWVFSLGCLALGMASAFGHYYRFAASDVAGEAFRARAISLVLAGGVLAGFIGPELAKHTKDLFAPILFLGSYVAVIGLQLASMILLLFVDIPKPSEAVLGEARRPMSVIVRQPVFITAVVGAMVGFAVMSLVMTATPLAMVACNHSFNSAATVIQWHVVAMFAPSFITGSLIDRFGVLWIMLIGVVLQVLTVAVAISGIEILHFWSALVLLGIGWNFLFVGGSTLLGECHGAGERAKVQAANDFLVFGAVGTASLSSGQLLHFFGWDAVNYGALPFLAVTGAMIVWLMLKRRRVGAAAV